MTCRSELGFSKEIGKLSFFFSTLQDRIIQLEITIAYFRKFEITQTESRIIAESSKMYKINNQSVVQPMRKVYIANVNRKSLLLIDPVTGQKSKVQELK